MFYQRKPRTVQAWQWDGSFDFTTWPEWISKPKEVTERTAMFNACEANTFAYLNSVKKELHIVIKRGRVFQLHKGDYIVKHDNCGYSHYNGNAFNHNYEPKEVK